MKIIKTEVVEIEGVEYQIDTYDNGMSIKHPWLDPDAPQPEPEPEPEKQITTAEMLEAVLINTEFLLAVNEMEGL